MGVVTLPSAKLYFRLEKAHVPRLIGKEVHDVENLPKVDWYKYIESDLQYNHHFLPRNMIDIDGKVDFLYLI